MYTTDLCRVVFQGGFFDAPGGSSNQREQFVHTLLLRLEKDEGSPFLWSNAVGQIAGSIKQKMLDHWDLIQTYYSNRMHYTRIDTYHLDENGHALHHAATGFAYDDCVGTQTTQLPYECAVAVSLLPDPNTTIDPHLRRHRGRYYLPSPAAGALDSNGDLSAGAQAAFLGWTQALLNDVQGMHVGEGAFSDYMRVVVASSIDESWRQVGRARVGKVIDSQRRRRRSLAEGYVTAAISHAD